MFFEGGDESVGAKGAPGARWFSWDRNGGTGGHLPNGIPDGYEFYLLERILVEGCARPLSTRPLDTGRLFG